MSSFGLYVFTSRSLNKTDRNRNHVDRSKDTSCVQTY